MALLGVDYFSLLGGFVGTILAVAWATEVQTRRRLALESILSTYIGALIGTSSYLISKALVPALSLGGMALLVLMSIVGALYFKRLLRGLGERLVKEVASRELPAATILAEAANDAALTHQEVSK
jgi:uncharacterized membrane protein YeaQ/YmgE (transglycosylase-associated protein family)